MEILPEELTIIFITEHEDHMDRKKVVVLTISEPAKH